MSKSQADYAVRAIVHFTDGSTTQQDAVRGSKRISRADFDVLHIGHLLGMTSDWTWTLAVDFVDCFEIPVREVLGDHDKQTAFYYPGM